MIKTFRCRETERLFNGERVRKFQAAEQSARRKLELLHAAKELRDLSKAPGNRLEKLAGSREGQYSIRINDQWRVCFKWQEGDAYNAEITDYHS